MRRMRQNKPSRRAPLFVLFASLVAKSAAADEVSEEPLDDPPPSVTPFGYAEIYIAHNFNEPANRVTNFRGFDNRSDTFALSNAVVGVDARAHRVSTHLAFQAGLTPDTYYADEPMMAAAGNAPASSASLWKYIQEAYVGVDAAIGRGLTLQAGIFASPIGPEAFAVKDNWNWSRSNLFCALPYYHAGVRASYPLTTTWTATVGVYNGWNNIIDNNEEKSVSAAMSYKSGSTFSFQALYFGGVERSHGAPEGAYFRHDVDAYAQLNATERLSFMAHLNGGLEPTRFGNSLFYGGALYARVQPFSWLYLSARGDRFYDDPAKNGVGAARPLFWNGSAWVSSATATVDIRPAEFASIRLEFRHDAAEAPIYFADFGNDSTQNTLLLGLTAWF